MTRQILTRQDSERQDEQHKRILPQISVSFVEDVFSEKFKHGQQTGRNRVGESALLPILALIAAGMAGFVLQDPSTDCFGLIEVGGHPAN